MENNKKRDFIKESLNILAGIITGHDRGTVWYKGFIKSAKGKSFKMKLKNELININEMLIKHEKTYNEVLESAEERVKEAKEELKNIEENWKYYEGIKKSLLTYKTPKEDEEWLKKIMREQEEHPERELTDDEIVEKLLNKKGLSLKDDDE